MHACALSSKFMHTCDFLRYICSKVSIWWAGLDSLASNKLLFQCCLNSGLDHKQLCGWPARATSGRAIHLAGMSHAHLLQRSDTATKRCRPVVRPQGNFEFGEKWFKGFKSNSELKIKCFNDTERLHVYSYEFCFHCSWKPKKDTRVVQQTSFTAFWLLLQVSLKCTV